MSGGHIRRKHDLRAQAEQACHHAVRLCLVSGVTPDMNHETSADELIRRNHALLRLAKEACDHGRETVRAADTALALLMEAHRRRRRKQETLIA